jgi:hypothetical protein
MTSCSDGATARTNLLAEDAEMTETEAKSRRYEWKGLTERTRIAPQQRYGVLVDRCDAR